MAVSRHLPQLMAVLSHCCAVLGAWCQLCTGYFRRGWMWTGMCTPQRPLLLGMLGVVSALPCEPSSHSACYTHSVSPIPLLHVASAGSVHP